MFQLDLGLWDRNHCSGRAGWLGVLMPAVFKYEEEWFKNETDWDFLEFEEVSVLAIGFGKNVFSFTCASLKFDSNFLFKLQMTRICNV